MTPQREPSKFSIPLIWATLMPVKSPKLTCSCLKTLDQVYAYRLDITGQATENPEEERFTVGSSLQLTTNPHYSIWAGKLNTGSLACSLALARYKIILAGDLHFLMTPLFSQTDL